MQLSFILAAALMGFAAMSPVERSPARYHGKPDLALTAAVLNAGGGAARFDAGKFLTALHSGHADYGSRLAARFGPTQVAQYYKTFDFAIADALRVATAAGVKLPKPLAGASAGGGPLCAALLQAGTIRDGRFDVGYMLEKLISRPIHVAIMHDIDRNPDFGPHKNAEFHEMLTTSIQTCKAQYGL